MKKPIVNFVEVMYIMGMPARIGNYVACQDISKRVLFYGQIRSLFVFKLSDHEKPFI